MTIQEDYQAAGLEQYHNGGGYWCMILQGEGERCGLYVLITDLDDCKLTLTTAEVHVGLYDDRTGYPLNEPQITTLSEGPALAARLIRDYQEPTA